MFTRSRLIKRIIRWILKRPSSPLICLIPHLIRFSAQDTQLHGLHLYNFIRQIKPYNTCISSTWVLICSTESFIYKVALSSNCTNKILLEYSHWQYLNDDEYMKNYIMENVELVKQDTLVALKATRYSDLKKEQEFASMVRMLDVLNKKGEFKKATRSHYMSIGLSIVKNILSEEGDITCFEQTLIEIENQTVHYGPAHGDFHCRNILSRDKKRYMFIDLDRFTWNSMQFLDAVHAVVDTESKENGRHWLYQLLIFERNQWKVQQKYQPIWNYVDMNPKFITISYFLDRIGKEKENIDESYRRKIREVLAYFAYQVEV